MHCTLVQNLHSLLGFPTDDGGAVILRYWVSAWRRLCSPPFIHPHLCMNSTISHLSLRKAPNSNFEAKGKREEEAPWRYADRDWEENKTTHCVHFSSSHHGNSNIRLESFGLVLFHFLAPGNLSRQLFYPSIFQSELCKSLTRSRHSSLCKFVSDGAVSAFCLSIRPSPILIGYHMPKATGPACLARTHDDANGDTLLSFRAHVETSVCVCSSVHGGAVGFDTGKGDKISYCQSSSSHARCLDAN